MEYEYENIINNLLPEIKEKAKEIEYVVDGVEEVADVLDVDLYMIKMYCERMIEIVNKIYEIEEGKKWQKRN